MPQVLPLCLRLLLVLLEDFPLLVIQLLFALGKDFVTDKLVEVLVRILQLPVLRYFKVCDKNWVKDCMGVLRLIDRRQLVLLSGTEGVIESLYIASVALE